MALNDKDRCLQTSRKKAEHWPELDARIIARRSLRYSDAAIGVPERPDHVRAGSGLNWFGGKLAVLQDDASFIGLVDPVSGYVTSITLPPDAAGHRLYNGKQGKVGKPDFECSVVSHLEGEDVLVAFGSGSTVHRERLAIVSARNRDKKTQARMVPAPLFYRSLRDCIAFSGSELNIEGAVLLDDKRLLLFQRGNGAPRGELAPVNSTCEISWPGLWKHLNAPDSAELPDPQNIVNYDLGSIDDVRLTFTDATVSPAPGVILYVASAEDSPDTFLDGEVSGTCLGIISGDTVKWGVLLGEDGECLKEKAEGVAIHPTIINRVFICIDPDDAARPTELCEVELRGDWPWLL